MSRRTLFTDNFNRSDNADLGADWDAGYGAENPLQILSETAKIVGLGTGSFESFNAVALPADQWAQISLPTFSDATLLQTADVWLRVPAPPTVTAYTFSARRNDTTTSRILKLVAGVPTSLITENATTWGDTDILRAEIQGSNLTLYRNDALLLTTTDSEITAGTRAGIYTFSSAAGQAAALDNFEAGDFTPAAHYNFRRNATRPAAFRPGLAR